MIETARLRLRPWRDDDAAEFMRVTNTPAVMEHLGGLQPLAWFERARDRMQALQAERGHCFWIVEDRTDATMLGFCGLKIGDVGPIAGEIEIGWRLREDAWGKGYAGEAARASLEWAWAHLDAPQVIAITVPANRRSRTLMERLGMRRRPELDFGHPAFAPDAPLHRHITHAIARPR